MIKISDDRTFVEAMPQREIYNSARTETYCKSGREERSKMSYLSIYKYKKIDAIDRGASIALLGLISKKINKSFKCASCKYTW